MALQKGLLECLFVDDDIAIVVVVDDDEYDKDFDAYNSDALLLSDLIGKVARCESKSRKWKEKQVKWQVHPAHTKLTRHPVNWHRRHTDKSLRSQNTQNGL